MKKATNNRHISNLLPSFLESILDFIDHYKIEIEAVKLLLESDEIIEVTTPRKAIGV